MVQAWHTAALSLADPRRFPKLADLLPDRRAEAREQSADEMIAAMDSIMVVNNGAGFG
jgi:hypothetical protein